MVLDPGFFRLKAVADLFEKLKHDFELLQANPSNSYTCFNFFVTAEHLPEWLLKGDSKKASDLRNSHAILRVCSHIANGGKHFITKGRRHTSAVSTTIISTFPPIGSDTSGPSGTEATEEFCIELNVPEAGELGKSQITVTELAQRLVAFWEPKINR